MRSLPPVPSFEDFEDLCDRILCPILLHATVVLDAYQNYIVREDCDDNGVLRANLSIFIMLGTVWHRRRAPYKRTCINLCINVCHAILIALLFLGFLDLVTRSPGGSGVVRGLFDRHSCRNMTGTFDHVKWSFYTTGQQCNTTAQEDVIQGAIVQYIWNAENGRDNLRNTVLASGSWRHLEWVVEAGLGQQL